MTPRRRIYPIFVPHAGCPHQCVFCNQKRISGSVSCATAASVRSGLVTLPEGAGYEVAFYGGSFTAIPAAQQEELLAAVQPFRESGTVAAVRCSTRPDAIDEGVIARLQRFGVETVELGCQSMDEAVLIAARRGHTAGDVRRSAKALREAGFHVILQMMTGLPLATRQSDVATARALLALQPDGIRIYPTVVVRDTELCDAYLAGTYSEHTVADAVAVCADILPLCEAAGVPVIRLGLNPTDDLSGGDAVAGAYHPALGELVRSEVFRRRAAALLAEVPMGERGEVSLFVAPERLSVAMGQHRANLTALREASGISALRILPREGLVKDAVVLEQNPAAVVKTGEPNK